MDLDASSCAGVVEVVLVIAGVLVWFVVEFVCAGVVIAGAVVVLVVAGILVWFSLN